jgi:hypothetical protein
MGGTEPGGAGAYNCDIDFRGERHQNLPASCPVIAVVNCLDLSATPGIHVFNHIADLKT